jgi:hypothetical protein
MPGIKKQGRLKEQAPGVRLAGFRHLVAENFSVLQLAKSGFTSNPTTSRAEWPQAEGDFIITMVAILDNKFGFLDNRPPSHVNDRYRQNLVKKKTLIAAVLARSRVPPVPAPALASAVFDPLDLVEWCAGLEAPIGLPGYATNSDSDSDSSSDRESAQLLSWWWSHREAEIAELPASGTGQPARVSIRRWRFFRRGDLIKPPEIALQAPLGPRRRRRNTRGEAYIFKNTTKNVLQKKSCRKVFTKKSTRNPKPTFSRFFFITFFGRFSMRGVQKHD